MSALRFFGLKGEGLEKYQKTFFFQFTPRWIMIVGVGFPLTLGISWRFGKHAAVYAMDLFLLSVGFVES